MTVTFFRPFNNIPKIQIAVTDQLKTITKDEYSTAMQRKRE